MKKIKITYKYFNKTETTIQTPEELFANGIAGYTFGKEEVYTINDTRKGSETEFLHPDTGATLADICIELVETIANRNLTFDQVQAQIIETEENDDI